MARIACKQHEEDGHGTIDLMEEKVPAPTRTFPKKRILVTM